MSQHKVKKYVTVELVVNPYGKMRPMRIIFDRQRIYQIDEILGVKPRCAAEVGGIGERYTCRIGRYKRYLWNESGKWFVEAHHIA